MMILWTWIQYSIKATEIQATDKTISKEKELPINFVTSVKTYLTNESKFNNNNSYNK